MATFVSDYRAILPQIGEAAFCERFFTPVVIGRGVLGELVQRPFNRKTAVLHVDEGAQSQTLDKLSGRVWPLQRQPGSKYPYIAVGRAAENDVVIPEHSISGNHCIFVYELNSLAIEDLGSLNGTMVGDIRIEPRTRVRLVSGEVITLGCYQFSFFTGKEFLNYLRESE